MIHLAFALLAATLGPEIQLSTPAFEPAPFESRVPAVTSNGTDFLVVWNGRDSNISAARVDDRGVPLDAQSLTVARLAGAWPISVASDGRDYVVSYSEGRSLRCARVDASSGEVTAGARIDDTTEAAIASNGRGYLLAYKRGSRLEAVALDANAAIAGGPYFLGFTESAPRIASNGEAYLIVSQLTRSDLTARLVAGGVVVRTETVTVATRSDAPFPGWSVASDGDGFLVVWSANDGAPGAPATPVLRVRGLAADGTAAGPPRTIVEAEASEPAVTWTGSRYFVTYTHAGDVRGIAVDAGGAIGAPIELAARETGEMESAAATNAADTLVVWTRRNGLSALIEGRLLDGPARVISTGLAWQESIAAAPHRTGTVAAWSEIAGDEQRRQVFVQRLDARGVPRDGRGIPVHESPRAQHTPAVAGSLVTWLELEPLPTGTSVWAKMLDAGGAPYGEAFRLGTNAEAPSIAVAGNAHLVVWSTLHGDGIVAVRVDPYAQTISEPILVSRGESDRNVAVVSDGSGFLLTWLRDRRQGTCFDCYPLQSVHAVAVTRWGVVAGPPVELTERNDLLGQPVPVWNGSGYAIFWNEELDGDIHVRRVRRNGLPSGAAQQVVADPAGLRTAAWSGGEYRMVVTREAGSAVVRLDPDFRVLEQTTIDSEIHDEPAPVVLVSGLLLYLSPNGGSRAIARRFISDK